MQKEIDEWLNISDYSTLMLAQAALRPGLTSVFNKIIGGGNQGSSYNIGSIENVRLSLIPDNLGNLPYKKIRKFVELELEKPYIIIGFCKYLPIKERGNEQLRNPEYYYQVNPPSIETQKEFQNKYDSKSVRFNNQTILNENHQNDLLIFFSSNEIVLNNQKGV